MAKDPAFLFYPGDWMGGTMTMTRSHKGAYMDLLMGQFNNGHMSLQDIQIILGPDYATMWESKLKEKFKVDSAGKYFNEKLEGEINKRKVFTESRRKNLNNIKKEPPHMGAHMVNHMENENENENKKENKGVQGEKEPDLVIRMAEEMEHPYLKKIRTEYPILEKMRQPLTNPQAHILETEFGDKVVFDYLLRMANWKEIAKKNHSVNLTLRNWHKKDIEKIGSISIKNGSHKDFSKEYKPL